MQKIIPLTVFFLVYSLSAQTEQFPFDISTREKEYIEEQILAAKNNEEFNYWRSKGEEYNRYNSRNPIIIPRRYLNIAREIERLKNYRNNVQFNIWNSNSPNSFDDASKYAHVYNSYDPSNQIPLPQNWGETVEWQYIKKELDLAKDNKAIKILNRRAEEFMADHPHAPKILLRRTPNY